MAVVQFKNGQLDLTKNEHGEIINGEYLVGRQYFRDCLFAPLKFPKNFQ